MFNIFNFFNKRERGARNSGPSTGSQVSESDGSTREGRRRQLMHLVPKVVERSAVGTLAGLVVMRCKTILTDVDGYEFVVLVDLESLPSPDVLHELDGKIARRAREKLGLAVKSLYWRGVEAPRSVPPPAEELRESAPAAGQAFSHVPPTPARPPRRRLQEPVQVDFAMSSPADLHLQELGLSRPAPLTA